MSPAHVAFCSWSGAPAILVFFFFNDTATTEIYTLSLHDALPISVFPLSLKVERRWPAIQTSPDVKSSIPERQFRSVVLPRSEEHTSELQSPCNLVCRLLLEKKKKLRQTNSNCRRSESRIRPQHTVYVSRSRCFLFLVWRSCYPCFFFF